MERLFHFLIVLLTAVSVNVATGFSDYKGVWSSNDAEAVLTDSICIFYARVDSTLQAVLSIPSAGICSKTIFAKGGNVTTTSPDESLAINKEHGELNINGFKLKKVEDIRIVRPYEPQKCNSGFDVGRCLQEWRLGAGYGIDKDMIYCEVNTNRHMFVYMVNPAMVYIRAAATRNNNNGTLFFQNIRMMKNNNTGEYTMYIDPDNFNTTQNDLVIDNSKFQPNTCTFTPEGGIYWSLISFEPEKILINGCGETYHIDRRAAEDDGEYIEYRPYSPDDTILKLNQ